MTDKMKKRIKAIPSDGEWWKRGSQDDYELAGDQLIDQGFSDDDTIDMLTMLYYAAASCFGG